MCETDLARNGQRARGTTRRAGQRGHRCASRRPVRSRPYRSRSRGLLLRDAGTATDTALPRRETGVCRRWIGSLVAPASVETAGISHNGDESVAEDDEQVRSLRALLFEEGRNLLLPDEKSPGFRHSVEQTRLRGRSVRLACWELQPQRFCPICRDFDGASRTRTGDLLGAIQALSQLSYSPVARPW
jgi:hypothetical protein